MNTRATDLHGKASSDKGAQDKPTTKSTEAVEAPGVPAAADSASQPAVATEHATPEPTYTHEQLLEGSRRFGASPHAMAGALVGAPDQLSDAQVRERLDNFGGRT